MMKVIPLDIMAIGMTGFWTVVYTVRWNITFVEALGTSLSLLTLWFGFRVAMDAVIERRTVINNDK